MSWEIHAHEALLDELATLQKEERDRVREAQVEVEEYLEATSGSVGPSASKLDPDVPRPDLRGLAGAAIRHSYRLRVGPNRVAVVILPEEEVVLATVLRRRKETTYPELVEVHERRFEDR